LDEDDLVLLSGLGCEGSLVLEALFHLLRGSLAVNDPSSLIRASFGGFPAVLLPQFQGGGFDLGRHDPDPWASLGYGDAYEEEGADDEDH